MDSERNKLKFFLFLFIVISFVIGGFILTKYVLSSPKEEQKELITEVSYKINKDEDYIYYENENRVLSYLEIDYKDIFINLEVAKDINNILNNEESVYRNSIKYIKDYDLTDKIYENNEEGIYSLTFREYENYEYKKYLSVIALDYNYDVLNLEKAVNIKSYIFDKNNNVVYTDDEILSIYETNISKIKEQIKNKLNAMQTTKDDGTNVIKIDETLNNFENYALFINKIGRLEIKYIVKSTNNDYYDNIVIE